jgi:hypothetical protein
MDPITLAIVGALAKLSENVIADAYQALKAAIVQRWGEKSNIAVAVNDLENNPSSQGRKQILAEEIAKIKADENPDITKLAEQLEGLMEELAENRGNKVIHKNVVKQKGKKQVGVNYGTVKFD